MSGSAVCLKEETESLITNIPNYLFQINFENYGIDWDGPVVQEVGDNNHVEVPETNCPLSMEQFQELRETVNPLRQSIYHGVDCYLEVLQFILNRLQ